MKHTGSLVAVALAVAAAAVVFQIKGTVREVEREIRRTERAIDEASWRLQTLKADYAYLTRPERLALQARQLGMVPGTSTEIAAVEAIAFAGQSQFSDKVIPVQLRTGAQLELRFKPVRPMIVVKE